MLYFILVEERMNHYENEQPVSNIDFGILFYMIRCLLLRHENERLHHHVASMHMGGSYWILFRN